MIKHLIENHFADVNIQGNFGDTILHNFARAKHFEIIAYLISKKASLFLQVGEYLSLRCTAYTIAFHELISIDKDDPRYIEAKKCFDLFKQAAQEHFYQQMTQGGIKYLDRELKKETDLLIGDCYSDKDKQLYLIDLKIQIMQDVLSPAIERYIFEDSQRFTFCLGSLPQKNSALYSAFWNSAIYEPKLSLQIFSYLPQLLPISIALKEINNKEVSECSEISDKQTFNKSSASRQDSLLNEAKALNVVSINKAATPLQRNSLMKVGDESKIDPTTGKSAPLPKKKDACLIM